MLSSLGKRLAIFVIVLSCLIHAFFGFYLDFSVDEAHYALYGLNLDWSYFDHPPLVGWIQALPIYLHFSVGFIRLLIPEVIWVLSILVTMSLTRLILDSFFYFSGDIHFKSAPLWAALCLVSSPILHVLGVGLLPDTLLMLIVPMMMWLTIKIHLQLSQRYSRDLGLWILLGFVLGLAALAKYTSLFFALAIPFCLISWNGMKMFKRLGFWICLLIAAILTSPIIYWNIQNEWISFTYQMAHGSGGEWKFKRLGVFLLNQMVCFGIISILGVVWTYRRHMNTPGPLTLFFIIPFLLFLYFSGGGSSLPHWTSPAWIALAPIAGIGLSNAWGVGKRVWIKFFLIIQLSLCGLGFSLLLMGGIPSLSMQDSLGKNNPIADLFGWSEAGEKIKILALNNQIEHLVVQNWTLGSRLAWYAKPLPVHILDERVDQFDLWFGKLPVGKDALLLNWSQMSFSPPVGDTGFESCDKVESMVVHHFGRDIAQFDFLLCKNWQGSFVSQRNDFDFNLPVQTQLSPMLETTTEQTTPEISAPNSKNN
jgi:4-amino-4-deoxy-L-arabinose transferase-like glycosyltransferase